MPYPLPLTRTEAYLAYKAGVTQQSDLKPSLAVPRNGIDAWLAYWTGLAENYPKKPTVNLFDKNEITVGVRVSTSTGGIYPQAGYAISSFIPVSPLTTYVLVCGTAAGGSFFSWYDSSKNYISGSSWQNKRTLKSPANARYIKFDFKESEKDIVQFEKAPLSPYSPYTNEPLILQEEEKYIAYLCGVINEYPENALHRVSAYLRYLISARWDRPDHPLNNEELYLSLIKTQFIPSGDPSSDIVIDGTTKAPFVDVKLYGDTAQNSYTGKNLSPNAGAYDFKTNQTATILSQTESSITFKTSGDNNSGILMYKNTQSEVCPEMFEDGYIFSCTAVADSTITLRFGTSGHFAEARIGTTPTRISAPLNNNNWICYSGTTVVSTITISDFQVEAGSTATSYEPFVGGQPSPSPSYPQDINVVTGTQTVSINGANYLIDLGSIELCKLDTHQDYIWKDGGDWKVHKATKSITASSNDFSSTSSSGGFRRATIALAGMANSGSASRRVGSAITNLFHSSTTDGASAQFQTLANMVIYASSATQTYQELMDSIDESGMIVTYALATPTDTTITDQTLIAQLDSLVNGGAEEGTTYIKVSATDPNLPAKLYVEAPKYD